VKKAGGQDFFRAWIDSKGSDKVVRIAPNGRLLSSQQVQDEGVKREIRVGRGERNAEEVNFDRLPGPVKTAIGRHAKSDEIQEVVRIDRNGKTIYRAEVGEGKFTRFIRVNEDGQVLGVRGDVDEGEAVRFDRTPGAVKSKIGALAKSGQVEEVIKYERGGKTYYQAEVEDQNGRKYFFTVDENGREIDDLPRVDAR
jgi:YHS domain-containing protein